MYRLLCLTFPVCSQCCASRNQLPRDKLHPVLEKHSPPLNWGMSVLAISFNGKQTVKLLFVYVYVALPPLSCSCSNKRQQQTKNHGDHWSCTQLQVADSAPLFCKAKKKNLCLCSQFWSQLFNRVNLTEMYPAGSISDLHSHQGGYKNLEWSFPPRAGPVFSFDRLYEDSISWFNKRSVLWRKRVRLQ